MNMKGFQKFVKNNLETEFTTRSSDCVLAVYADEECSCLHKHVITEINNRIQISYFTNCGKLVCCELTKNQAEIYWKVKKHIETVRIASAATGFIKYTGKDVAEGME